jgi:hypothetical protein
VFEHLTAANGNAGKSLFYFDARTGVGRQIWVTQDSSQVGGLKLKMLIDRFRAVVLGFRAN